MKKLMENWRRYKKQTLIEQAPAPALVDINAGPSAVLQAVPQLLGDPKLKKVLTSGRTDAGGPQDEAMQIKKDYRRAADLTPTQSQIGTGQSLNDQAGDKWGNLDRAIQGGKLASKDGEFPILVFDNYVLDGHHRWSQFVATNPDANVEVAEIVAPGVDSPDQALALAHYINFALYGKSPTKDFKGQNLYQLQQQPEQIRTLALQNMAETTPQKLYNAKLIAEPTPEAAATHFANNLANLPGPGRYPRLAMPQPADAGDPTGLTQTPKEAAAGVINYNKPTPSDIEQEEAR